MTAKSLGRRIIFRVSDEELAEIRAAAKGEALSKFVRSRVLLRRGAVNNRELFLRAELARVGDLLANLLAAGSAPSEVQRALDAVVEASQQLRSSEADRA